MVLCVVGWCQSSVERLLWSLGEARGPASHRNPPTGWWTMLFSSRCHDGCKTSHWYHQWVQEQSSRNTARGSDPLHRLWRNLPIRDTVDGWAFAPDAASSSACDRWTANLFRWQWVLLTKTFSNSCRVDPKNLHLFGSCQQRQKHKIEMFRPFYSTARELSLISSCVVLSKEFP